MDAAGGHLRPCYNGFICETLQVELRGGDSRGGVAGLANGGEVVCECEVVSGGHKGSCQGDRGFRHHRC